MLPIYAGSKTGGMPRGTRANSGDQPSTSATCDRRRAPAITKEIATNRKATRGLHATSSANRYSRKIMMICAAWRDIMNWQRDAPAQFEERLARWLFGTGPPAQVSLPGPYCVPECDWSVGTLCANGRPAWCATAVKRGPARSKVMKWRAS